MRKGNCLIKLLSLLGLMLSCMSLSSCNKGDEKGNIIDQSGKTFEFAEIPSRVVCLEAYIGDIWNLAGGEFIGITSDYNNYNLSIDNATVIGSAHSFNSEVVLSLQPDLVLYSSKRSAQVKLAESFTSKYNIPCFDAQYDSLSGYLNVLNNLTKITNKQENYQTYGNDIKNQIDNIINLCPNNNNPKVAFARCNSTKYNILASGNIVTDMLKDLKCINIAPSNATIEADLDVQPSEVAAQNPDYIFYTFMGLNNINASRELFQESFLNKEILQSTTAMINNNIIELDPYLYHLKPNDRWAEAYQKLYEKIYQ